MNSNSFRITTHTNSTDKNICSTFFHSNKKEKSPATIFRTLGLPLQTRLKNLIKQRKTPVKLEQLTDEYLFKLVQQGEVDRLGLLYERYNRDLYAYFYRCTSDALKSEDLVQTVFYRILKYKNQFAGKSKFIYWMFTIARNVWINDYNKKNPLRRAEELTMLNPNHFTTNSPGDILEKSERKKMVHRALNELAPEKKEAILLSRFQGLKYHEIAKIAGCTENAIKSRIQRGLSEMKTIIQKLEAHP